MTESAWLVFSSQADLLSEEPASVHSSASLAQKSADKLTKKTGVLHVAIYESRFKKEK